MSDIKRSINAVLYDRIVSPLSGSFLISWSIINWKIIYISFFQSNNDLPKNKIEMIDDLLTLNNSFTWPFVSTILLITIYPFISEKAYQISLFYRSRKKKLKNKYEQSQLLTLEQSLDIRLQLKNQMDRFDMISTDNEKTITDLKSQNEALINRLAVFEQRDSRKENNDQKITSETSDAKDSDYIRFKSVEKNIQVLKELFRKQPVWSGGGFGEKNIETIKELELLGLVIPEQSLNDYNYTISEKGKAYLKRSGV